MYGAHYEITLAPDKHRTTGSHQDIDETLGNKMRNKTKKMFVDVCLRVFLTSLPTEASQAKSRLPLHASPLLLCRCFPHTDTQALHLPASLRSSHCWLIPRNESPCVRWATSLKYLVRTVINYPLPAVFAKNSRALLRPDSSGGAPCV